MIFVVLVCGCVNKEPSSTTTSVSLTLATTTTTTTSTTTTTTTTTSTTTTSSTIIQEGEICLYIFHNNKGKPCLEELDFLKRLQKKYPNLVVKEFITNTPENIDLFYNLTKEYGVSSRYVPVTFIGDKAFVGYSGDDYTGRSIEKAVKSCVDCRCPT